MIWVDGLHYSPMAFLLMTAAFRAMDPALEESAMMSGASVFQVAWRVTLQLTWPAIFATILILFVRADRVVRGAGAARPAGRHPGVHLVDLPGGAPLSEPGRPRLGLRGDAARSSRRVGVYFQSRLSSRGIEVRDDDRQGLPAAADRPRARGAGSRPAIFIVYFLLIVVLPFSVLLWSSFQKFYAVPSMAGAAEPHARSVPLHPHLPEPHARGVEQPAARVRQRDDRSCW